MKCLLTSRMAATAHGEATAVKLGGSSAPTQDVLGVASPTLWCRTWSLPGRVHLVGLDIAGVSVSRLLLFEKPTHDRDCDHAPSAFDRRSLKKA